MCVGWWTVQIPLQIKKRAMLWIETSLRCYKFPEKATNEIMDQIMDHRQISLLILTKFKLTSICTD